MPSDEYIRDLENNRIFRSYGYDEGYKDGYKKGYDDGFMDASIKALDRLDDIEKAMNEAIYGGVTNEQQRT